MSDTPIFDALAAGPARRVRPREQVRLRGLGLGASVVQYRRADLARFTWLGIEFVRTGALDAMGLPVFAPVAS